MKPHPRFWTRAESSATDVEGWPYALRIWGWSSHSLAEAAALAQQRLAETVRKLAAGEPLSHGYYPRSPLREELLAQLTDHGARGPEPVDPDEVLVGLITRNRYGVEVLNTDRVLIADIDLPAAPPPGREPGTGLWSRLLGRGTRAPAPDPEQAALQRIELVSAQRPEWGFHSYRTAAGFRVFVTGGDLPPATSGSESILHALGSDPLYITLCTTSQTYRARLTPKPWRAGSGTPTSVWPHDEQGAQDSFARWHQQYYAAIPGYATARLLSRTGPEPDAISAGLLAIHDEITRATEVNLPLA